MCPSQDNRSCVACRRILTRRDFVKGCGAALAAGGLVSPAGAAEEPKAGKVRVALVYLSKQGSSWPSPVFDVAAREKEVLGLLKKGCGEIDFEPEDLIGQVCLAKVTQRTTPDGTVRNDVSGTIAVEE